MKIRKYIFIKYLDVNYMFCKLFWSFLRNDDQVQHGVQSVNIRVGAIEGQVTNLTL